MGLANKQARSDGAISWLLNPQGSDAVIEDKLSLEGLVAGNSLLALQGSKALLFFYHKSAEAV